MRLVDFMPRWLFLVGLLGAFSCAWAVPATILVTPTSVSDDGTGGAPDGYRLYRGCDLAAQTTGAVLADPLVVGTEYSFTGDTDNSYAICAVAFNAAGAGGFGNVVTLTFDGVVVPPGDATVILSCEVDPASGVIANCVQTN